MCQQKVSQSQYDQIMQHYEARRRFIRVNDEDLNGFPSSNYCFIGLLSLFDPSRVDVPDSIVKLRRAHIRVAMITGDHPSTAKVIAKQVNIFSREISEINGLDTFQIEQNQTGQVIIRLYRNETLLEQHLPTKVTPFNSETKADRAIRKQIETDKGKGDIKKEPPWYQRCYSSCKNQFIQSKPVIDQQREKEKIPNAILVSYIKISIKEKILSREDNIY
jgi:magnesium-transporting ATPase (P-type)